jgi:hypothetical protein
LEKIIYSRERFFNDINVSRPVECQLKMADVRGGQTPARQQEMLEKFENSSKKPIAEHSMSSQKPLESVLQFSKKS